MKITVTALVNAPLEAVWSAWNTPEDICQWNAASDDWHTPRATVDLRLGGSFTARMEARDGSMGFDFTGFYTAIEPQSRIAYKMEDGREVEILFTPEAGGVRINETFDAENIHPPEMQREGWQSILNNFARHVQLKVA